MNCFSDVVLSTRQLHCWLKQLFTRFFKIQSCVPPMMNGNNIICLSNFLRGVKIPHPHPLILKYVCCNPRMFTLKMPTNSFRFYFLYTYKLLQLASHFMCHCSFYGPCSSTLIFPKLTWAKIIIIILVPPPPILEFVGGGGLFCLGAH